MSQVLTAKRLCEESLGAIGELPVSESAADGESLRRAMTWLDMICAQLAGTDRILSLVPATIPLVIVNGTSSYNLNAALGASLPLDRVQFPVNAWLEDAAGNRSPLDIVTSDVFESVDNASDTGTPTMIYIDRATVTPTLKIYPTPPTTDTNVWTIKLKVQTYAPNVAPGGVTGTQPSASVLTNFAQAWQRYLVCQLAHDLGSGPIRKLPEASLNRFAAMAKTAKTDLLAFNNREHEDTPPVAEAWGN